MAKSVVLYDPNCGLCRCIAAWLRSLDWGHRLAIRGIAGEYIPHQHPPIPRIVLEQNLHVETPNGRILTGFRAFRRMASDLPALWPLAPLFYLPGAPFLGEPAYRWVADHRQELSRFLALTPLCRAELLSP